MSKSKNGSFREEKRARFASSPARKRQRRVPVALWIVGSLALLGIVGGILIAISGGPPQAATAAAPGGSAGGAGNAVGGVAIAATAGHAPYPLVEAEGGVVRLPLGTFDDGKAHFYTYMNNGRPIEFFVLKSSDGVVRAAFNACDVCFPAKKGYRQEGDEMVCNNCGSRFASNLINEVRGGCNPAPLERTVEGETLLIKVDDLVQGQTYF